MIRHFIPTPLPGRVLFSALVEDWQDALANPNLASILLLSTLSACLKLLSVLPSLHVFQRLDWQEAWAVTFLRATDYTPEVTKVKFHGKCNEHPLDISSESPPDECQSFG